MYGIVAAYCNACVIALLKAYCNVMRLTAREALNYTKYGKGDTRGIDSTAEIIIQKAIKHFDPHAIVVTEETDSITIQKWPSSSDRNLQPIIFIIDPIDRSKFFAALLETVPEEKRSNVKVSEMMNNSNLVDCWENDIGGIPASITGATSAITCIARGKALFSVIVNYITGEIMLACELGLYQMPIPADIMTRSLSFFLNRIVAYNHSISFSPLRGVCGDEDLRFVTYVGPQGNTGHTKRGYEENLINSRILYGDPLSFVHYREPGGPSRILYLSDKHSNHSKIGFILGNGEKIGEWAPWLPFVKFAKNRNMDVLKIYEIYPERPLTKEGILMATPPPYSIFQVEADEPYIDISRLKHMRPSHFRSMIVVAPANNDRIICIMEQNNYRDVTACL